MVEIWYTILAFMLTAYLVLDGRNFGAGALHLIVARTEAERGQVIAAIGPLWSWDEVWLIASGGVLFVAFPRVMAAGFTGYYLALFLVLWALILRGIALETRTHLDNPLWQGFWDFILGMSSILLAVLFGAALGNVARGVPLDQSGEFQMAFFTNFRASGYVGLLDWYTVSFGMFALLTMCAHGGTFLTLKTEGVVHERSERIARRLWIGVAVSFVIVAIETWCVRRELIETVLSRPLVWLACGVSAAGGVAVFSGIRGGKEMRGFVGSYLFIIGLFGAGAASMFPVLLFSTLGAEHSLTAYSSAAGRVSLVDGLMWWPIAMVMAFGYYGFILRKYRGKVKPLEEAQGAY